MKTIAGIVSLAAFILSTAPALALTSEQQRIIDWTTLALSQDAETLAGRGPIVCRFRFQNPELDTLSYEAHGNDVEIAGWRLLPLCIKHRAERINDWFERLRAQMSSLNPDDFADLLRGWGWTDDEIRSILAKKDQPLSRRRFVDDAVAVQAVYYSCLGMMPPQCEVQASSGSR